MSEKRAVPFALRKVQFAGHCRGLAADQHDATFASLTAKSSRENQSCLALGFQLGMYHLFWQIFTPDALLAKTVLSCK